MKRYLFCVALSLPVLCVQPASGVPTLVCGACRQTQALPSLAQSGATLFGMPAFSTQESDADKIFSTPHKYVYRVAFCLTPKLMQMTFHNDTVEANKWLDELSDNLNRLYERDLGVRLELVRRPELLMTEDVPGYSVDNYKDGTAIINHLISSDAYDLGMLIREGRSLSGSNGNAPLGGVYHKDSKGSCWAESDWQVIGHELGHMFGANHAHDFFGGLCTEPGDGQSLMSYGQPRDFFSLASIKEIRTLLAQTNYYLSSKRDPNEVGGDNPRKDTENLPYIELTQAAQPVIDRRAIKKEYTVTNGTCFQFYIPTVNPSQSMSYVAHPYDVVTNQGLQKSNSCMPAYETSKGNCVMFQPYYNEPNSGTLNKVEHSDGYRNGLFTFLLSAYDKGRYETERVILKVVDGEPFRITSSIKSEYQAGEKVVLKWNTCKSLYGEDSKVRILLSDDFGQTYKYVLADDLPNNGSWEGHLPHLEIARTWYRDLKSTIPAGVLKVEVIGEAAYDVSHKVPYNIQNQVVYSGGFTLSKQAKYIHFENPPAPFIEVEGEANIPPKTTLVAYHSKQQNLTANVECTEERHGNVIRRTWLSPKLGGLSTPIAYTQVITVRNSAVQETSLAKAEAEKLGASVFDLLKNEGELGYPKPTLAEYAAFREAAKAVYNKEVVRPEVTTENVTKLRTALNALEQLKVGDLVLPATGDQVRLRNYQQHYGVDYYYYVKQSVDAQKRDEFTPTETEGTVWTCSVKNGEYTLTANGRTLLTQIFNNGGTEFTLDRGCTWGSFMLVNKQKEVAVLDADGKYLRVWDNHNPLAPRRSYRNSANSTEFQFTPVRGKEVGSLTIATAEGYGTVYTADAYVMPQGVTGYTVTGADNARGEVTLHEAYASGATVPAQTALVVRGGQRTYKLFAPQQGTAPVAAPTNYLQGAVTAETTKAPNGQPASDYYFYKLYYSKATGTPRLGFYWGAAEGAPFESAAGKAYLALPRTMAAATTGFALPLDPTTGLCTPVERPLGAQPQAVYTLSGVRLQVSSISQLPSGVYIVDGKKVVVK